jgi:hypothetical protein
MEDGSDAAHGEGTTARAPPQGAPSSSTKGPVFPLSKIKSLLQRNEDVGIVTQPSLELVGAASAAFVKSLVEAAAAHRRTKNKQDDDADEADTGTNDFYPMDDSSGKTLVTLEDLRHVVSADERFRFVADALNGPEAVSALQREDDRAPVRPRRVRKKRQRDADSSHLSSAVESRAKLPPGRIKDPPPSASLLAGDGHDSSVMEKAARRMGDGVDAHGLDEDSALGAAVGAALLPVAGTRKLAIEVDEEDYD